MEKKIDERLRIGFASLKDDEGLGTGKRIKVRPINYGHAEQDHYDTLSEQSYHAFNKESGKWEKRTIRR